MKNLYNFWLRLSLLVSVMMLSAVLFAQAQNVSGVIRDEMGESIPGVSILEKGTTNGTSSDGEGKYTLRLSTDNATLVFSFIGYKTQEVLVGSRSIVDITLAPDITSLEEIVVTGYTSERKQDIVAAVSTISAKNTVAVPVPNVEQAIQGRVAGVTVITSGQPGATSQIRIRGFGSFTNNAPLYIVDDVPTFDVSDLDPNDIETTTVLKDAGAASIYGARAASGVVVYTTKHGKRDGKVRVTYDMSVGLNFPGEGIDVLSPQQTAQKTWEAFRNAGQEPSHPQYGDGDSPVLPEYINIGGKGGITNPDPATIDPAKYNVDFDKGAIYQVVKANKEGTDWYDAMTRVAPVTRHSLGLSGGNENSHYYLGLGYYNQQGIAINQYLKRYTARFNSEFTAAKRIRIGENMQVTYKDNPLIGDPQSENQLNHAYRMNPIIPVRDEFGGWAGTAAPGLNNPTNPVASLTRLNKDYNQQNRFALFGNVYAEVDLLKNLTFRSSFGGGYANFYAMQFLFRTYENSENNGSYSISEAGGYLTNWVWTNTARYNVQLADHNIKVLAGYEALKDPAYGRFIAGTGLNPFSTDPNFIGISNASSTGRRVDSGPEATPRTLASIFGKVDYNFQEKYYLSALLRRDGSSAFGAENRIGYFPAITGAWRISSEGFMDGMPWVEELKIRAGWGIMGNQNVPAANQFTLYAGSPAVGYDISGANNSISPGIVPQQIGNPMGAWERNITTNVGLDATLMDGTLDIILDVWKKKTEDLLFNPTFAATGGVYNNYPYINVGSIDNRGIDLQIIKRQRVNNDLDFVFDGNIAFIKNEIDKIAEGLDFFDAGTFRNLTFVRNSVGQGLSSFYGYKMIGYFASDEDVENSPQQSGAAPGRFKFADVNGDNRIDASDRVFIGTPIPKFTYGLNVTANYKAFSLEMFFYGKYGNDIVNFSKWFTDFYPSFSGAAIGARTLNSWSPENRNAETPIFENVSNFSTNTQANSWYVEKGSYLRMKNLQLNYNLPPSLLQRIGIEKLKVFVQAVNLFTITKYEGKDPEIASSVDTTLGVDVGNYPATRIYSVGLNLGL